MHQTQDRQYPPKKESRKMALFFQFARIIRVVYNILRAVVGIVTVGSTVHRWSKRRAWAT